MLSKPTVEKLQKIIEEEYGKKLNPKEAEALANGLVAYFDLLAKTYHQIKLKNENEYEIQQPRNKL